MNASQQTRWDVEQVAHADKWQAYVDRFTELYESGEDADGEARFVDALAERGSRILDAGCGAGRVGAALQRAGHLVVGVDKDAGHVDIGRDRYPTLPLLAHDLLTLNSDVLRRAIATSDRSADVPTSGGSRLTSDFDIVVLAGNVMVYLAPGTERDVLAGLTSLLRPGGRLVTGFATGRDYSVAQFDADADAVGLSQQHRFGTWQLGPYDDTSDWVVTVLAQPQQ